MAVKFQDYYEILGVPRTASEEEISKAYRKNPEKRKKYDALGLNWHAGEDFTPPPGWQEFRFEFPGGGRGRGRAPSGLEGVSGFSDFFEMLFGEGLGGAGRRAAQPGLSSWFRRDHVQEADLTISLEEVYRGVSKSIVLRMVEYGPDGTFKPVSQRYEGRIPPGVTEGTLIRLAG